MKPRAGSEYVYYVVAMAEEVDRIIQDRLARSHMKDRSVHLHQGADLGIEIVVDEQTVYREVEHIVDRDIRDVVQASIDEWLARQVEDTPDGESRFRQSSHSLAAHPSSSDLLDGIGDQRQGSAPRQDRTRLPYALWLVIALVLGLLAISLFVGGAVLLMLGMLVPGAVMIALVVPFLVGWIAVQTQCPRCKRPLAGKLVWSNLTQFRAILVYHCRYCGYRWDRWHKRTGTGHDWP